MRLSRLGRGAGSVAATLLGLLALTFFMGRMLPTDPVIAIIGEQQESPDFV
jgi:peptide/nickel transport system permease protein